MAGLIASNKLHNFFNEVEHRYGEAAQSIVEIIDEGNKITTTYLEINFIVELISKLRQDIKVDSQFNTYTLEEMLKGGHLKLEDNGSFYDELVERYLPNLHKRFSSHHSIKQQYSISGPVIKEVLFGVSVDKEGKKTTWMQFERHHTRSIIEFIMHIYDYLVHKWTGQNIGPFGASEHTEKNNPLILVLR